MNEVRNVFDDVMFSYGVGYTASKRYEKISLRGLSEVVVSDDAKNALSELRSTDGSLTEKRRKKIKDGLPWVTLSGVFEGSRAKEKFNSDDVQFVQADFDKVVDIAKLRNKLHKLPCVAMCFLSPSGNGVKAVIFVEKGCSDFLSIWTSVAAHLKDHTGLEIDPSTKDISRIMYLSYDKDCYINEKAVALPVKLFERKNVDKPHKEVPVIGCANNARPAEDMAKVMSALPFIPNNKYDTWVTVGMGLHNSFNGSEEAKCVWMRWSAINYSSFDRDECEKKWLSFSGDNNGKKYTISTIFHLAKYRGWKDERNIFLANANDSQQDVVSLIDNYVMLNDGSALFVKDRNYEELKGRKLDAELSVAMKSAGIDKEHRQSMIHSIPGVVAVEDWWGYEGITRFDGKDYLSLWKPGVQPEELALEFRKGGKALQDAINQLGGVFKGDMTPFVKKWMTPGSELKPGDALEIFRRWLAMNYPGYEDIMLSWVAQCVHGERSRQSWGICLYGGVGSGKSLFFETIMRLIGERYGITYLPQSEDSSFNGEMSGKRHIFYDEMVAGKKDGIDFQNRLKSWITASRINIHGKGKQRCDAPNHAFYGMATNRKECLPLEEKDRRWLVLESKIEIDDRGNRLSPGQDALHNEFLGVSLGNLRSLWTDLKNVRWDSLPANPPRTEAFDDVITSRKSDTEDDIALFIENAQNKEFIIVSTLNDYIREMGHRKSQIKGIMDKFGYIKVQPRDENGKKIWCWVPKKKQ